MYKKNNKLIFLFFKTLYANCFGIIISCNTTGACKLYLTGSVFCCGYITAIFPIFFFQDILSLEMLSIVEVNRKISLPPKIILLFWSVLLLFRGRKKLQNGLDCVSESHFSPRCKYNRSSEMLEGPNGV
jgi:hypothetical protein